MIESAKKSGNRLPDKNPFMTEDLPFPSMHEEIRHSGPASASYPNYHQYWGGSKLLRRAMPEAVEPLSVLPALTPAGAA